MPKPIPPKGADALAMAAAILGPGVRIVGASLRGNKTASSVSNGTASLSTGIGEDATPTTYIDIDFVPETDHLQLGLALNVEELPKTGAERVLEDGLSIWMNGSRCPIGNPGGIRGEKPTQPPRERHLSVQSENLQIGLRAVIGVARSRLNSLRIATSALAGGLVLSSLAVSAEAAPGGNGKAVGNPGTGNNGNGSGLGNANNSGGGGGGGGGSGGGGGPGNVNNMTATDDVYSMTPNSTLTVDVTANDIGPGNSTIFITQINGVDIEPGDTITLATGETITLNADGTLTIVGDVDPATTFDYTVAYGTGNAAQSDTATVTINTVPCFVAGTMIRTDRGDVPVECLKVGQLVMTRDEGLQPIRWIGQRTLPAEGKMAPIRVAKNTFGEHAALQVSPLHRLLIRNTQAEILFGDSEVLIAARDLVDDHRVRQLSGGFVHYVHLLFDRHQIIWSEGLQSESFLPGPQTTSCFESEIVEEIRAIFPELNPLTGAGYGPAARPTLRAYEARLLVA